MERKIPALGCKLYGDSFMDADNTLTVGKSEGDYASLGKVDFGDGKRGFKVTYCWSEGGASIVEIRLDDPCGKSIGVCTCITINETHSSWCEIEKTSGVHEVYLVFHRKGKYMDFAFTVESPYDNKRYIPVPESKIEDAQEDSWEAIDMLGRKIPSIEDCGEKRDKKVGIFYWNWHAKIDGTIHNLSKVLKEYPEAEFDKNHPVWKPGAHYWNEPLFGFYRSNDAYVLRKHAVMLAAAGVDFITFDCTNVCYIHRQAVIDVFDAFYKARVDGINVPKITFMLNLGAGKQTEVMLRGLYQDIYKPGLYSDLWFMHEGKPLIIAYPQSVETDGYNEADTKLLKEIRNFFTFRPGQAGYTCGPKPSNNNKDWAWLECMPLHKYGEREDGSCEQMAVGVAQNSLGERDTYFNREGTFGRSYTSKDGHSKLTADSYKYGYNFQEQWDYAIKNDPDIIFVTGWNEWVGTKITSEEVVGKGNPQIAFYDQYNKEYSRDIEPDCDGILDTYYLQLVKNIRRFKGTSKMPETSAEILPGEEIQWADIKPHYKNFKGSTAYRNHYGRSNEYLYVNNTSKNDITECRVARDSDNIYFYAECLEDIKDSDAENSMVLYLNLDRSRETGWEGYEMRVVGSTLQKSVGTHYEWEKMASVKKEIKGNTAIITIPKKLIGLGKDFDIEFKWSDNAFSGDIKPGNIMDFYVNGVTAPIGRFNFRYKTK